jgi:DNA polymerase-1
MAASISCMFYVIDASVYVFRAWFSIPDDMQDSEGNPVNALYGFARFLSDFLEHTRPEFVAVAFDTSLSTCFRNDLYPDYKANREPAPAELKRQFDLCRAVTRALGMPEFTAQRFEADDIIGTLVTGMRRQGMPSTILTRDKDMAQLLDAGDVLWDFAGGRRIAYKDVRASYGVRAEQMIDYLALAGDSVDNIPGVRGVGPKTAAALLEHFDSLDNIYTRLDEVAQVPVRGAAKLGARLAEHKDMAFLSRQLSTIACDVPLETDRQALARQSPDLTGLNNLYDEARFGQSLRRQAERIAAQF